MRRAHCLHCCMNGRTTFKRATRLPLYFGWVINDKLRWILRRFLENEYSVVELQRLVVRYGISNTTISFIT